MLFHLFKTLQENVGSIRRGAVLAPFGDRPSFGLRVLDRAVIGRDSLELDLDVTLV